MARTVRSRNLDLIRWMNYGHESTAKLLLHITNANYLSKMATGEMEIGDRKARSIERAAEVPSEWLDRDNIAVLKMSPLEFKIHRAVISLAEEKKAALLALIASDA